MDVLRKNFTLIVFTVFVFGLSLIVYSQGSALWVGHRALRFEIGGVLGVIGLVSLILIYLRPLLRPFIKHSYWLRRAWYYLNLVHPYLGIIALAAIFSHGYLMAGLKGNFLVRLALYLITWQVFWGFVISFKRAPAFLKRKGLLMHTQIIIGVLVFVLALIGHQLFG